jgi:hypothetical protein
MPALTSASDSGVQGDGITNVTTLTVTGMAEAGSTVKLYDTEGTTVLGTGVTTGGGTYSITSSTLTEGNHTLHVSATDIAGNVSVGSAGGAVTLDTTAPGAPALALANDTGSSITDAITSDPTITVAAESGATLLYKADGATSFSTTAPVFAVDGSADGSHTVLVEQQDAAGNIGAASSLTFTLDTTAPHVTGLPASLANGTGETTIDFTLTFNEAVTLPLALNNGNSAAYDAAVISALGDSSKLVFDHLVAAGNTPVSFVEVAAFIPHGSVVVDIAGNIADVSHVAASFGHPSDDTFSPPHMPFAFDL